MTDFTKQVGWSPSIPSSSAPASVTVATDNGDGTGYITNPDGTVVPVVTTPSVDTFATISGSTITDPSGNSITVPSGSTYNAATSTLTTSDGNTVDLSSFDTDTDTFATLAGNVITFADGSTIDVTPTVDTDTTYALTQNANGDTVLTGSDSSVQTIANTNTDVSAVKLEWDTDRLRSTVTEDGNDVVGELVIPDGARECGDKALMVDPVTRGLKFKSQLPERQFKVQKIKNSFGGISGAAVDATVGTVVGHVSLESPPFAVEYDCFRDRITTHLRLGNYSLVIGTPDDRWRMIFASVGQDQGHLFSNPTLTVSAGNSSNASIFYNTPAASSDESVVDSDQSYQVAYEVTFSPQTYTPHGFNFIAPYIHGITISRENIKEAV